MNNKTYGFTMALYEYYDTVPTLWDTTKKFFAEHPDYLAKNNGLHFMTDEPERLLEPGWNLCHFWSNYEVGDLRFWRSKEYMEYFEYLDKSGGFFYERWGDAPVHSIAAVTLLDKSRLHHFDDIGYFHNPWNHCPANRKKYHDNGKCNCDPKQSFDRESYSCLPKWWRARWKVSPSRTLLCNARTRRERKPKSELGTCPSSWQFRLSHSIYNSNHTAVPTKAEVRIRACEYTRSRTSTTR